MDLIMSMIGQLLIPLVLVAVTIATVKVTARVSRKTLLIRWLITVAILFVLIIAFNFLIVAPSPPVEPRRIPGIIDLPILLAGIAFVRWSAGRAQDAGWSKWLCLLYIIPLVNVIFFVVLLFKGPAQAVLAQGEFDHDATAVNRSIDRRKFAFQIAGLIYVVFSVPLLSVSFVLPTISVGEAIGYVVATPVSLFTSILMFLLVLPTTVVIILAYLILSLVWLCLVVIGQPVPPIVHFWASGITGWSLAPFRNYKIHVREQGFNYLTFVLAASTLFVGFRLLQAFSDV